MSPEIVAALVGLIGVVIGALPTYLHMRQKVEAETEKLKAEADKTKAEAQRIRAELQEREARTVVPPVPSGSYDVCCETDVHRLTEAVRRQRSLLVYICDLHQTRYGLEYWRITYLVDDEGGVHTKEEMAIIPREQGKVHFRRAVLGVMSNVAGDLAITGLRAVSKLTNQDLEIIEIRRDTKSLTYAVVLDPPATHEKPAELVIESYRPGVFEPLVSTMRDRGCLRVSAAEDAEVEMQIVAPARLEFVSFSMSPDMGGYEIDSVANRSRIRWYARNLATRIFAYTVQAREKV